jgi:putative membrane protein insertion efficiency factor
LTDCRRQLSLLFLAAGLILAPQDGFASSATMKGPSGARSAPPAAATDESTSRPLLGAIRFFQAYISPIDGARCQFAPTCSAFGHQAISRHGPWLGLLMTTDRLMRCSYWTDPVAYPHLPNGRLADPVAANLGGQ